MSQRWYETFFDTIALDVWQQSRTDEQTAAEIDYLDGVLGVEPGARLLDLACGNGRHAVGLAARGYAVTGVDISEENRERAAALAAAAGVSIEVITGDITAIEYDAAFDGGYMWGNSLGYFPREATSRFFASVARALVPGARFVVDSAVVAESILGDLDRRSWVRVGADTRVLLESRYSTRESRLDTTYTTIRGDRVVGESTAHVWIFTSGELIAMAEGAGLQALDLHGDLEGDRFELGDEQLVLILERR